MNKCSGIEPGDCGATASRWPARSGRGGCRPNAYPAGARTDGMGFRKHLVNGIVSTVISVAVTAFQADGDEWTTEELLLSVAVSAFLSGFFTSYFAE